MDDMLRRQDEIEVRHYDSSVYDSSDSRASIRQIVTAALTPFTRILWPLKTLYGNLMLIGCLMANYS